MPAPQAAKKPQDRQTKKSKDEVAEAFEFERDGKTYTFKPTLDALTPGFVRRNRHNETEYYFSLLEALADDKALDVLDNMTFAENTTFMRAFSKHVDAVLGVSLGE